MALKTGAHFPVHEINSQKENAQCGARTHDPGHVASTESAKKERYPFALTSEYPAEKYNSDTNTANRARCFYRAVPKR